MIAFWAQSLDNESSNLIGVNGSLLSSAEEQMRQQVVSNIYQVVSEKTKVTSTTNVAFYRKESKFVIEAVPLERDVANRLSPIVIIGDFPVVNNFSDSWIDRVCTQIEIFVSESMNRTLSKSTLDSIKSWLTDEALLQKKKRWMLQGKIITLIISALLAILLGWLIQV